MLLDLKSLVRLLALVQVPSGSGIEEVLVLGPMPL